MSNDEGSSESENTNTKNIGDNVLNDGISNGSNESLGIDPDKVVGRCFNQYDSKQICFYEKVLHNFIT